LEGLAYGPDFVEGSSCYNCGNTLAGSPQCPLCGRDA
jgi:rubrerythrin